MAHSKSALKRNRQSIAANLRNRSAKSALLTLRKKVLATIDAGKKEDAAKLFIEYTSLLDKTAKRGIIKKNNASRKKSRMALKIAKIGTAPAPAPAAAPAEKK